MSDKHRATYHGLIADDETSERLAAVDEVLPRGRKPRRKADPTSRAYRGASEVGMAAVIVATIAISAGIICSLAWGIVALVLSVAP